MTEKLIATHKIIDAVDQIIIDTGTYQAIDLLLHYNFLSYGHYEQWRTGKIQYLCNVLDNQKRDAIFHCLEKAEHYVKSLKMLPEKITFQSWQAHTSSPLFLCLNDNYFSDLLSYQYLRQNSDDQMDLFFDNQALTTSKELKQALIDRNIKMANQKLQELYNIDPHNTILDGARELLDHLVNAIEEEEIEDIKTELNYLLDELSPLAQSILSAQKRDYLSFFWYRLARQIDDSCYDETEPYLHSAFCFAQIPDWPASIGRFEAMPKLKQQAELFKQYLISLNKHEKQSKYIPFVCQFFWQFPDNDPAIFMHQDPSLKTLWQHFLDDKEEHTQWTNEIFPSWLLISNLGMSHYSYADKNAPEDFLLLQKLILSELKEKTPNINLRKQVNAHSCALLEYYLKHSATNV